MDAGTKVYKANLYVNPTGQDRPYYMMEATATGVVVDGVEMVRIHDALLPVTDGWRATETEAKADIDTQLCRVIGQLQKSLDTLREEVLHETLTATPQGVL
jgi:hypothetical protein